MIVSGPHWTIHVTINANGDKALIKCWDEDNDIEVCCQTSIAVTPEVARDIANELIDIAERIEGKL